MSEITASIVIPTYNRPDQLKSVLEALSRQSYPGEYLEVLVVDDGSRESYQHVVECPWPFHLRYYKQENQGEVIARNFGVSLSQGRLIIFLDDDIYIEPQYVTEMIAGYDRYPEAILLGVLHPWQGPEPSLFQSLSSEAPINVEPGAVSYIECGTGTMSVGKSLFEAIGGMQSLGPGGRNAWGGMDFAYRAYQAGYQIRRCPRAVAYHDDFALRDLQAMSQRYYKVSRLAVLHFKKYPELLPQVPMFRDKTPIDLKSDSPKLILRKIVRAAGSSQTILNWLQHGVQFMEIKFPSRRLLARLYQWIISGHMYLGYRQGLREFEGKR